MLGANVWLALEVSGHAHHDFAETWYAEHNDRSLAFCRVTQMALLRHFTNRAIMRADVLTQVGAWAAYRKMVARRNVCWLPEPQQIEEKWEELGNISGTSGSWWTDAYLAAFAMLHDIRLVTFDRDFLRFELLGLKLRRFRGSAVPLACGFWRLAKNS